MSDFLEKIMETIERINAMPKIKEIRVNPSYLKELLDTVQARQLNVNERTQRDLDLGGYGSFTGIPVILDEEVDKYKIIVEG